MSRVIFLSDNVNLTPMGRLNRDLVLTLVQQGFDVTLLTSLRDPLDNLPPQRRLQVLQPFRSWSVVELIRLAPALMEFKPDVVHLGQTETLKEPVLHVLTNLLQILSRPLVVSSIWDTTAPRTVRSLARWSDHVLVCNKDQARALPNKSVHEFPVARWSLPSTAPLEKPLSSPFERFVCVPAPLSAHRSLSGLQELVFSLLSRYPECGIVFTGETESPRTRKQFLSVFEEAQLSHRLFWAVEDETTYLAHAELIALSTLPLESASSVWSLRRALAAGRPLLLEPEQSASWNLKESASETSDEAGNFLSRLYADGLEQKRNHT